MSSIRRPLKHKYGTSKFVTDRNLVHLIRDSITPPAR